MKFSKPKIKRCKNCIYYQRKGVNIHACTEKGIRKYNLHLLAPLKLICFRKKVEND